MGRGYKAVIQGVFRFDPWRKAWLITVEGKTYVFNSVEELMLFLKRLVLKWELY